MIKMIENYDALFGAELKLDDLQFGTLGTQDVKNLHEILLNDRHESVLSRYSLDETVDDDEIFAQMAQADEEAKIRHGGGGIPKVKQEEVEEEAKQGDMGDALMDIQQIEQEEEEKKAQGQGQG